MSPPTLGFYLLNKADFIMAKVKKRRIRDKKSAKPVSPFKDYWSKVNYVIFSVGFLILILGFFLMAQGPWDNPISLTLSPIVLMITYFIIFPVSILYNKKKSTDQ